MGAAMKCGIVLALAAAGALPLGCGDDSGPGAQAPQAGATVLVVRGIDAPPNETGMSDDLAMVDVGTGEWKRLETPSFSGGDAQFAFVAGSDRVAYRCTHGACVSALDSRRSEEKLGDAWCIAPSDEAEHVWLAELHPDSPATERAISTVTELDFEGRTVTGPSTLPERRWHCPAGSIDRGLLFFDEAGVAVWDATTSKPLMTIPDTFPAAAQGALVATYPDEGEGKLRLTDVAGGSETLIDPPSGWRFEPSYEGAFSPDGSRLAATVLEAGEGAADPFSLAVIDTVTGRAEVVPSGPVGDLAWAPDGSELYVASVAGDGTLGGTIAVFDEELRRVRTISLGFGPLALQAAP